MTKYLRRDWALVGCDVFLKIYPYDPTSKFQELEIGSDLPFMQSKMKICKTELRKENVKSKIAQNLSYRFFINFGSKRDSSLQINCENFIIHVGFTVGF